MIFLNIKNTKEFRFWGDTKKNLPPLPCDNYGRDNYREKSKGTLSVPWKIDTLMCLSAAKEEKFQNLKFIFFSSRE